MYDPEQEQKYIPRFYLSRSRYLQICHPSLGYDYESMFYRILVLYYKVPGIVIKATYGAMRDRYELRMYSESEHVATAYLDMDDLNELESCGYTVGSINNAITAPTIYMPTATIATATNELNISTTTNTFINPKDKVMNKDNFAEYDADTIDAMIDTLLQKKAELDDIESRWKTDNDFNNGDVVVVEYAYTENEDAKVYTAALLKTPVGWFTTLTNNLIGSNKYSQMVRFFEKIYVKKVTYLALSEGVEMFSNVDKSDASSDYSDLF